MTAEMKKSILSLAEAINSALVSFANQIPEAEQKIKICDSFELHDTDSEHDGDTYTLKAWLHEGVEKIALFNDSTGKRRNKGQAVTNPLDISRAEFEAICNGHTFERC